MTPKTKRCYRCQKRRPAADFPKDRSRTDGLNNRCKACNRAAAAEWQQANGRPRRRAYELQYYYGISEEQYNSLCEHQEGRCAICRRKPRRLYVDHCHTSLRIRGLLCTRCNSAIGLMLDSAEAMRRAAAYLEENNTGLVCAGRPKRKASRD